MMVTTTTTTTAQTWPPRKLAGPPALGLSPNLHPRLVMHPCFVVLSASCQMPLSMMLVLSKYVNRMNVTTLPRCLLVH